VILAPSNERKVKNALAYFAVSSALKIKKRFMTPVHGQILQTLLAVHQTPGPAVLNDINSISS
jgi:hypothetical protein